MSEYMEKHAAVRNADLVASMVDARAQAFAQLGASGKRLAVVNSETLGSVEVLGIEGRGVLAEATADRVGTMRAFLAGYAGAYGLSTQQLAELELVADYVNPAGNMAWVEFEQRLNGLPVFQGSIRGGFTAKGELARTAGHLAPALDAGGVATSPSLSAAQAISRAAADVGWDVPEAALVQKAEVGGKLTFDRGPMASDARAWLAYFPLYAGVARLAWVTEIWGDPDVFLTVQDAEDGTVLWRKNLTSYQTQFARYVTYKSDSPAPSSPTTATPFNHEQAPYVDRAQAILIGNEGSATFNTLGWMTDDTNHTDGNNVEAGLDIDGTNGVDAPVTGSDIRVFNFSYDPETEAPTTANYRNGEVTNMFYWVNRFHDRTYLLGFTEQSFNFQHNNFGRGGAGNDRISAEGQDSGDTNNANFSTPADGGRGRMQMYVWTGPTPDRSSGLDQDVILHELTHGLSNRLHGNAMGLSDNMAGGLGEGWSDFYARALLLASPDEDVNGIYTVGGWVTHLAAPTYTDNYYYGIRRFPYAPRAVTGGPQNRPHSPLTFADTDSTQFDISDGAFPRGPFGSSTVDQVHNLGEIWAGMLWEVRSRFLAREGFDANFEWLQYVTDGMKLSPLSPNFLQARDAILAAAAAGGATQDDIDDIWAGFAARGLGFFAAIMNEGTGSNDTRVVESVLLPDDPAPTFSINDVSIVEGNAGTATATFTVTLANPSPTESRVSFATADGTATSSSGFAQGGAITISDSGPSTPYPSSITVPGGVGTIQALSVQLNAFSHTFPGDVDVLLVGPTGQTVVLMSDVGSGTDATNVNLTFRDGAASMPTTVVSGTYAPTNIGSGDLFPAPAPAGPHGTTLSAFNGTNPNGTWSLYVVDDAVEDTGSFAGGWSLLITTAINDFLPGSGQLVFPSGITTRPVSITINGDGVVEPNETFSVNLSAPGNAIIADNQGLGTILNDDGGGLPTTVNDAFSAGFNTPLTVAAPGVLANDSSNGGGALLALLVGNVSSGSLTLGSGGNFTYTPNAGFVGADSFTYRAVSLQGAGNVATVAITVHPPAPPVALNDAYNTAFNTPLTVSAPGVLANDTSTGGAMTAAIVTTATSGSLALDAGGGFTYTPNAGFVGTDSFTYLATNPIGPGNIATVSLTVAEPTTLQPPTDLYVSSMEGNVVTFRWKAFPFGPQPTSYVIAGGINPGEVLASLPIGGTYPIFTVGAPDGSFFVRVHAVNASETSGASNEIRIYVNVPEPPSSPVGLVGMVNGDAIGLAWRNTFAGGAPSSVTLDVTGSLSGSVPLGLTDKVSFPGVPGGTYTLTVRETNATGTSAPSNAVTLTLPGPCSGAPLAPINFLAYKVGNTVHLVWDPAESGAAPTSYIVNVTGSFVGSFPTTARSISGGAPPGTYTLTVTGVNDCGSATTSEQTITIP